MYKIGDTFDVDGKACRIIGQAEVYNFGWKQTIFCAGERKRAALRVLRERHAHLPENQDR